MSLDDREEASYYGEDRRSLRKERKQKQKSDRSKYKKSDQEKQTGLSKPEQNDKRGRVLAITGQEITVYLEGKPITCVLRGALKKEKTDQKNLIAVGDFVFVNEQNHINHVEPRYSLLSRSDNLRRNKEQILATNIDLLFITVSTTLPALKVSLIDRYAIAAKRGNLKPVIVLNKMDLPHDEALVAELKEIYERIGIPFIPFSTVTKEGLDELLETMQGKASVLSGQSGVGKTSLINLITGSNYRTAAVLERTNKGVHTTTAAKLIPIAQDTFTIDTPGVKSFALWDISEEEILSYFSDLQNLSGGCKFSLCTHTHEPGCGVLSALSEGKISKVRYDSYLSIRGEKGEDQKDKRVRNS